MQACLPVTLAIGLSRGVPILTNSFKNYYKRAGTRRARTASLAALPTSDEHHGMPSRTRSTPTYPRKRHRGDDDGWHSYDEDEDRNNDVEEWEAQAVRAPPPLGLRPHARRT